jgi:hypothetical protein
MSQPRCVSCADSLHAKVYDSAMDRADLHLPAGSHLSLPTVQLQHTLPDGLWHIDWLLARSSRDDDPLLSFRIPHALSELDSHTELAAEWRPDHRRMYLHFEGRLSHGGGEVQQQDVGWITAIAAQEAGLMLDVRWQGCSQCLLLQPDTRPFWKVLCLSKTLLPDTGTI